MDFLSLFDITVVLDEHPLGLVYAKYLVTSSRARATSTVEPTQAVHLSTKFVPTWNGSSPRQLVPLIVQRANTRAAPLQGYATPTVTAPPPWKTCTCSCTLHTLLIGTLNCFLRELHTRAQHLVQVA